MERRDWNKFAEPEGMSSRARFVLETLLVVAIAAFIAAILFLAGGR